MNRRSKQRASARREGEGEGGVQEECAPLLRDRSAPSPTKTKLLQRGQSHATAATCLLLTSLFVTTFGGAGLQAILRNFLTRNLQVEDSIADSLVHVFIATCCMLAPVGGYVADKLFGHYWLQLLSLLVWAAGLVIVWAWGYTSSISSLRIMAGVGVSLSAIGIGLLKAIQPVLYADQVNKTSAQQYASLFAWYYFAFNASNQLGESVAPQLRQAAGFHVIFVVMAVAVALGATILALGKRMIVVDRSRMKKGFEVSDHQETITKTSCVFGTLSVFWCLFNQMSSTWVQQGDSMVRLASVSRC